MVVGKDAGNLDKICGRTDVTNTLHLGFINMTIGKVFEQVFKSEDVEFFFQEIGPKRADTFQVFNRIIQYGGKRNDGK